MAEKSTAFKAAAEPKAAAEKPVNEKFAAGTAGKASPSPSAKPANGRGVKPAPANAALLERAGAAMKIDQNGGTFANRTEQFASFQTDAPSCDNCGAITVRNGNCYLCHNCGNSMGCS
jgi:ribonucleoside-diphosphate reductase alpha chain